MRLAEFALPGRFVAGQSSELGALDVEKRLVALRARHLAPWPLETLEEAFERRIGFRGCFLLHPMTDTGQDDGSAKIRAGHPRVLVEIHAGNEGTHRITLGVTFR